MEHHGRNSPEIKVMLVQWSTRKPLLSTVECSLLAGSAKHDSATEVRHKGRSEQHEEHANVLVKPMVEDTSCQKEWHVNHLRVAQSARIFVVGINLTIAIQLQHPNSIRIHIAIIHFWGRGCQGPLNGGGFKRGCLPIWTWPSFLCRPISSTYEEQSRHNQDPSRKKVGHPPVRKPETPRFSFSQVCFQSWGGSQASDAKELLTLASQGSLSGNDS